MKRKYRLIIPVMLAVVLLALFIPYRWTKVNAVVEPAYPVRILEIVDQSSYSVLKDKLKNMPNVSVDVMRMKTFVAMREDISGTYDAIYIADAYNLNDTNNQTDANKGKSTNYSTSGVAPFKKTDDKTNQTKAHQTSYVMNDITSLKANEIRTNYINKGLPVIVNENVLKQLPNEQGKRNLYDLFNGYNTPQGSSKSNVYFVNDNKLNQLVTDMNKAGSTLYQQLHQRPRIDLTSQPADYSSGSSKIYKAGDTLTFKFNAYNVPNLSESGNSVTAKLSLSVDKVLKYTDDNQVALKTITQPTGNEITYNLPKAYSGLLYWKLDLYNVNGLTDSVSGTIRYQDEKTVVKVLQVMPDKDTSSDLTKRITDASYLKSSDYELQITPVSFSDFSSAYYKQLNGKFDMIVFGFKDTYNESSPLKDDQAIAVHAFIESGQGVMFTHDTIYKSSTSQNAWVKYFQADTGQIAPETNLGFGNPLSSTSTKNVNTGLLTQFPFDLTQKGKSASVGQIATTHNQYFTLDLEDPAVVPWYNIKSDANAATQRDVDDSWNHYYTYTKGNVTYSGTGHTSNNFPDWEQRLFVNTMFRAFIGANHAPDIKPISPVEGAVIPSYQKIPVSYTVNDLDLKDRNIKTQVKMLQNNKEIFIGEEKIVLSGSTISLDLDNPLKDVQDQGQLKIVITASDLHGAQAEPKTINITVKKFKDSLQVDRSLDSAYQGRDLFTKEAIPIHYTVQPVNIAKELGTQDPAKMIVKNLEFTEELPANLEVAGITFDEGSGSIIKSGTLATGYTLKGTLPDVPYQLVGSSYVPTVKQVRFTVSLIPKEKGNYLLNKSSMKFTDIDEKSKKADFPVISFSVKKRLETLKIEDHYTILKGASIVIPVTYTPTDVDPKSLVFTWSSSDPKIASVDQQGKVVGASVGTADVTVYSTDGSKLSSKSTITVVDPILTLKAPKEIKKGETGKLQAIIDRQYLQNAKLTWTVTEAGANPKAELIDTGDSWSRDLKGKNAGTVTIEVTLSAEFAGSSDKVQSTASAQVRIINPLESIGIDGDSSVIIGKTLVLKPVLNPADAENVPPLLWSFKNADDGKYASLDVTPDGVKVTGKQKGTVIVQLKAGELAAEHAVEIKQSLTGLQLPYSLTIYEGDVFDLTTKLAMLPHGGVVPDQIKERLIWSSDNTGNVTVIARRTNAGTITGKHVGQSTVRVKFMDDENIKAEIIIEVKKKPAGGTGNDRY